MLYYKLNGYEDFKQRFGLEGRGNGTTVRKNKILLGHLKSPLLLSYCVKQNDYSLLHVDDMADLQKKIVEAVRKSGTEDAALPHEVELIGEVYRSAKYRTDESKGVCEDLDKGSVRYVNVERDRVFKMKSGKFHEGAYPRNPDRETVFPECAELALRRRVHPAVVYLYLRAHSGGVRTACGRRFQENLQQQRMQGRLRLMHDGQKQGDILPGMR